MDAIEPADAGPFLFVDASAPAIQVGLSHGGRWVATAGDDSDALDAVFRLTARVLDSGGVPFHELAGLVYCHGPGSTLGLRITCMAIEGWRIASACDRLPIYRYGSLHAAAAQQLNAGRPTPFRVAFRLRKDAWLALGIDSGAVVDPEARLDDSATGPGDSAAVLVFPRKRGFRGQDADSIPLDYLPFQLKPPELLRLAHRCAGPARPCVTPKPEFVHRPAKRHGAETIHSH